MLLWSYFTTVLTDPGGVPPNWRPSIDEESGDADPLVGLGYEGTDLALNQPATFGEPANPQLRVCRKCNQCKPPRCHHCSVCEFFFFESTWFSFLEA
jgi:palmitoyltransferase